MEEICGLTIGQFIIATSYILMFPISTIIGLFLPYYRLNRIMQREGVMPSLMDSFVAIFQGFFWAYVFYMIVYISAVSIAAWNPDLDPFRNGVIAGNCIVNNYILPKIR